MTTVSRLPGFWSEGRRVAFFPCLFCFVLVLKVDLSYFHLRERCLLGVQEGVAGQEVDLEALAP